MNFIKNFGRILYALVFLTSGFMHLTMTEQMKIAVPNFIPGGIFWVYFTGIAFVAASISIIFKIYIKLACLMLALMLFIFVLTIHLPGMFNPEMMKYAAGGLMKDSALAAAALYIAGTFANNKK